jgi:acyl-CoA reductase-like NAD-dependent aldehyde dehydrogenase
MHSILAFPNSKRIPSSKCIYQCAQGAAVPLHSDSRSATNRETGQQGRWTHAGVVWIYGAGNHFMRLPFGGVKSSGNGREESLDELLSYTQIKSTTVFLN